MRIGLLEDDLNQVELINLWAKETGDHLQSYKTGKNFRDAFVEESFDMLILDWHLPDTTGIKELDWIRGELLSNVPVLFITSRDSEQSVIEALEHGADDYMVKPVNRGVTIARIKALQRRHAIKSGTLNHNENDTISLFEPFKINQMEQTISIDGDVVKLTNKEFELASYLFHQEGCLVDRQTLMETVWGTSAELNTRTVDTHISRIRSKLGINPSMGWQLSSIYQRGYRLFRVTGE